MHALCKKYTLFFFFFKCQSIQKQCYAFTALIENIATAGVEKSHIHTILKRLQMIFIFQL